MKMTGSRPTRLKKSYNKLAALATAIDSESCDLSPDKKSAARTFFSNLGKLASQRLIRKLSTNPQQKATSLDQEKRFWIDVLMHPEGPSEAVIIEAAVILFDRQIFQPLAHDTNLPAQVRLTFKTVCLLHYDQTGDIRSRLGNQLPLSDLVRSIP